MVFSYGRHILFLEWPSGPQHWALPCHERGLFQLFFCIPPLPNQLWLHPVIYPKAYYFWLPSHCLLRQGIFKKRPSQLLAAISTYRKKKNKNTGILGRSNRKSKLPHSYPLFCRVLHIKSKLLGTGFADAPKFQGTHSISTQNSVSVPFSHKGMQINFSFEFWPATMRIRKQRIKSYLYPS